MERKHVKYLLKGFATQVKLRGDRNLLISLKNELVDYYSISNAEDIERDLNTGQLIIVDDEACAEVDNILTTEILTLYYQEEEITKDLWINNFIPTLIERLHSLENECLLTSSDMNNISLKKFSLSIESEEGLGMGHDTIYKIHINGCGMILILETEEGVIFGNKYRVHYSPYIVEKILNILHKIDFCSLDDTYSDTSKYKINDTTAEIVPSDDKEYHTLESYEFELKIDDKFKKVKLYGQSNIALTYLAEYIDKIYTDLKKYKKQPEKCPFCNSTKITKFSYDIPIEEVKEKGCECGESYHCLATCAPKWYCEDCETIFNSK